MPTLTAMIFASLLHIDPGPLFSGFQDGGDGAVDLVAELEIAVVGRALDQRGEQLVDLQTFMSL